MKWRRPALFEQVVLGFAGGFFLLAVTGGLCLRALDAARRERDRARVDADLRDTVEDALSLLKDVETGGRGYAVTRRRSYLEPFERGEAELGTRLARAASLAGDADLGGPGVTRFLELARRRTELSRSVVAAVERRAGTAEVARLLDEGKAVMDQARAEAAALIEREEPVERAHRERARRLLTEARAAVYVSLALAFLLFTAAAAVIRREISRRERLADRARASQAQLQSILDNTPAAVYIKDSGGRYVLTNRRLERLFGRSARSLLGRTNAELMPPDSARALRADDEQVLKTGMTLECEETIPLEDGPHVFLSLKFLLPGAAEPLLCGVSMDITDRKRADALKSEVIALASHELRAPLSIIQGAVRHMMEADASLSSEDARELLDMAHRNSRHMLAVINNYLDLAAIESGRIGLESERVDLCQLASEAADTFRRLPQRGLRCRLVRPEGPVTAQADASRVREVLHNLLSNAAKYSPDQGEVELTVELRGGRARASVRDHGPGIRKEFRDRVFGRFARDPSRPAAAEKGTGLGLSICKALVERMGGVIGFETEEGEGTTFFFDLPLAREEAGHGPKDEDAADLRRRPGHAAAPGGDGEGAV